MTQREVRPPAAASRPAGLPAPAGVRRDEALTGLLLVLTRLLEKLEPVADLLLEEAQDAESYRNERRRR